MPHLQTSLVIYYHYQKDKRPKPPCKYPGIIRESIHHAHHLLIYLAKVVITVKINDKGPPQEAWWTFFCQEPDSGLDLPLINLKNIKKSIFIVYASEESEIHLHYSINTHTHTESCCHLSHHSE